MLDADGLGGGDLHVIDVAAVPHRLEHAVGEPEHEQVLNGLLPEIVIDAIHLVFVEMLMGEAVEGARAVEVGAERFLDDDAPPATLGRVGKTRRSQVLDHGRIDGRGNREVEEHALGPVDLRQAGLQPLVERRIVGFATDVVHPAGQRFGDLISASLDPGEFFQAVAELGSECLVVHLAARDADDRELRGKTAASRQAIDRRQKLAAREIARRTKDDERRRPRRRFEPKPIMKRIAVHLRRSMQF